MMAVASSPTVQPRMDFQAVSSQAGCEAVLPQIPPRRANTQGNDDMAAITGCCKTHNLFFSFLLLVSLDWDICPASRNQKGACLGFLLDLNVGCFSGWICLHYFYSYHE